MRGRLAASIIVIALFGAACSSTSGGEVVVSAATSLAESFAEMEAAFEARHPDVDVIVNVAGTPALREQIIGGAPVDVFAAADTENMDALVDAGRIAGDPAVFATNEMAIATPVGNPGEVSSLSDLERADLLVGMCDASVPCGSLARSVLANAGIEASIDTNEPNVASLATKIAAGELDAGIVYGTDVIGDAALDGVSIPEDVNVSTVYPIAVVADGANPQSARLFVDYVLSAEGGAILERYGFGAP